MKLTDLERCCGCSRHQNRIGAFKDRVDLSGDTGFRGACLSEAPVGDQATEPRHVLRALLKTLGMGQRSDVIGHRAQVSGDGADEGSDWVVDLLLEDLMAELAQRGSCVIDRGALLGAQLRHRARRRLKRDRYPQWLHGSVESREIAPVRAAIGGRVEKERCVGDCAGEWPVNRHPIPTVEVVWPQRDPLALRLETEEPVEGGGDSYRSSAIGALRHAAESGRGGCARTAARATCRVVNIPRVAGSAEGQRLREGPDSQLRHACLADHDCTGLAQPCYDVGVVGRRVWVGRKAPPGCALAQNVGVILDRHRNSEHWL